MRYSGIKNIFLLFYCSIISDNFLPDFVNDSLEYENNKKSANISKYICGLGYL